MCCTFRKSPQSDYSSVLQRTIEQLRCRSGSADELHDDHVGRHSLLLGTRGLQPIQDEGQQASYGVLSDLLASADIAGQIPGADVLSSFDLLSAL